jgi:inorganic triphosphatase YgiF
MTHALLLTDRLCDLTEMALQAYTKFEKATVFAATRAIRAEFREVAPQMPPAAEEKLASICHAILGAVEYTPTDGRTNPQCIVCARNDIVTLREMLKQLPPAFFAQQKERLDGRSPATLQ